MEGILSNGEISEIELRIRQFEERTKCELLLVLAKRSDAYPAASWRFGILAGFFLSLTITYYFELAHAYYWPPIIFALILLMVWVGHFDALKRLTLSPWETDAQCEQKAIECFHSLGTSKVSHKVTAMIFLSLFEHKIEVLVDETLKQKLGPRDLQDLVEIMSRDFRKHQMAAGLGQSIQTLEEKILLAFQGPVSDTNPDELSNTIRFI